MKLTCAPRPCASCPYRKDAPSGLWEKHEYDKLPAYDGDIIEQLAKGAIATFGCHQKDGNLCAGWLAAHGADNLLAIRLQGIKVPYEMWEYETDIPVFKSGAEARKHGLKDLKKPGKKAQRLMVKLPEKGKPVVERVTIRHAISKLKIVEVRPTHWWRATTYYVESEFGRAGPMSYEDATYMMAMGVMYDRD